jgi:hypothetical protein
MMGWWGWERGDDINLYLIIYWFKYIDGGWKVAHIQHIRKDMILVILFKWFEDNNVKYFIRNGWEYLIKLMSYIDWILLREIYWWVLIEFNV